MPFPLYALALAVFAMGTSEFMLAGLLPGLAAGLGVSTATAGLLGPAFAIGMVVGAPLLAALARHRPGRSSLLGFLLAFAAAHAVGAVTTNFPVLCATRVLAAFANAGFLAVALTTAVTLVPADRKGRALAVLLSGTTLATIAGVPGGALLGAHLGWRATFWSVAALCLPAALGILSGVPGRPAREPTTGDAPASDAPTSDAPASDAPTGGGPGSDGPSLRGELAQLARPGLLLVMLLGALVNAATFGSLTFLAPVVTGPAGLGTLWVPVALVLFGTGSLVGVSVAGRLSDQHPGAVLAVGGPALLLGWPALALLADRPAALLVLVFVQGALSFALGATLIARVLHEATGAPTMGGSYATAALNLGAAVGPLLAAATLGAGAGNRGPLWGSGALVLAALLLAYPARAALPTGGNPLRAGRTAR